MTIHYKISPDLSNEQLNQLFAEVWDNHTDRDFAPILERSLGYVCAYDADEQLIGFVNIAWDGGIHAFILDTSVHPHYRRRGIGIQLVQQATDFAKTQGIEWLHVDYEDHLDSFYKQCGFQPTLAGLINLQT